jgi:hypothetical protein
MKSSDILSGCELPASASDDWWYAVELLAAVAAWSLRMSLKRAMAQPFNKLVAMLQDPDLEVMAGSFGRSVAVAQGAGFSLVSRHGGETERKLVSLKVIVGQICGRGALKLLPGLTPR